MPCITCAPRASSRLSTSTIIERERGNAGMRECGTASGRVGVPRPSACQLSSTTERRSGTAITRTRQDPSLGVRLLSARRGAQLRAEGLGAGSGCDYFCGLATTRPRITRMNPDTAGSAPCRWRDFPTGPSSKCWDRGWKGAGRGAWIATPIAVSPRARVVVRVLRVKHQANSKCRSLDSLRSLGMTDYAGLL